MNILRTLLPAACTVLAHLVTLSPAHSQIDAALDRSVWKQKYNVLDAQINEQPPYAGWLGKDDDGDGVKNADELAAGTSPFQKGPSEVHFALSAATADATSLSLTFPTVAGKLYQAQSKGNLSDATWAGSLPSVAGTGTPATLTVPQSAGNYFRIQVSDQSSQGDGVSDWAKQILGFATDSPITAQSSYNSSTLSTALATQQNVVTLTASDPATTAPPDGVTPAPDLGVVTVSRGGYYLFSSITVPLAVTGTAQSAVDYLPLPASITLPAGVKSVDLKVTPLFSASRKSSATVIVTLQPGGGFTVGAPAVASVTLLPSQTPSGTGLTGSYYVGAHATYTSPVNFGGGTVAYTYTRTNSTTGVATITYAGTPGFSINGLGNLQFTTGPLVGGIFDKVYSIASTPAGKFTVPITGTGLPLGGGGNSVLNPPVLTRLDSRVDYVWGTGATPIANNGAYTVRWTGQVQPQYTGTYYFDTNTDDGVKLWVNGQLIVDKWINQGPTDWFGAIDLQAGVLYDIKMEYDQTGGGAEAHLLWFNNDQVRQIIPTARLYPAPTGTSGAAPPAITSASSTVAFVGQPFAFSLTGSNGPNTYALTPTSAPLPAGLSLNTSTGLIGGTPSVAGEYQVTVQATNIAGTGSAALSILVLNTGNSITREIWIGLAGPNVSDLQTHIALNTPPSSTDNALTSLEDNSTQSGTGSSTGERLRGYITVPRSGNYYFYLAANGDTGATGNVAELWISNNKEPVNKVRRCLTTGPTGSTTRNFLAQSAQKSGWLSLVAGQKYYLEVLHNVGTGGAVAGNLAVGWFRDPTGSTTVNAGNVAALVPVVPGYVLSPWDNPATTAVAGSLYVASLQALPGVSSVLSGGAYLRLSGSTAIVRYSTPAGVTSRGIYTGSLSSPTLVFDLDAQDKFRPELRTNDGGYTWSGISGATLSSLTNGAAFLLLKTANNPGGEARGVFSLVSGSQTAPAPPSYPSWPDDHGTDMGASRFLTQTTFGPSPADMASVKAIGYRSWIDNQLGIAATRHMPYVLANANPDPNNLYPSTLTFNAWWQQSVTASDQLRQRVAFALSEIMVISDSGPLNGQALFLSPYYDTLLDNCLGNFRTLLKTVTLAPAMGVYLDMRANAKGDLFNGIHPNENYAREIQQLFSVGLYRRWPDGTLALDSAGSPVPTYNQTGITGFARALTGWNWGQPLQGNGRLPTEFYPDINYLAPMTLVPTQHELGSKIGLDNVTIPAANAAVPPASSAWGITAAVASGSQADSNSVNFDNYCLSDLDAVIDQIMNNSIVAPYICRQLIQRLVTSNPEPAYVHRVVRAFNGEQFVNAQGQPVAGDGTRGNMQEVIRAILLDYEARSSVAKNAAAFGKQREPLLRVTGPARAFPAASISGCNYREVGGRPILITTPSAHRLNNGDTVVLSNWVDAGASTTNLPTTQSYSPGNTTPAYTLAGATGIATITAPAYQAGDIVPIQFTSGILGSNSPFNTVQSYTVTGATGTNFTVNIGNTTFANTTGNTVTPNHFTVNASSLSAPNYTSAGNTVTVTSSGYIAGHSLYVKFSSGGLLGAGFDGAYVIAAATGTTFTLTLPSSPANTSGACLIPRVVGAGYTVVTNGAVSTVTVVTGGNHGLNVSDQVQLDFTAFNDPTPAVSGIYPVASVIDPTHFTVTTTPAISDGSVGNAVTVYPLAPPPLARSGTLTIKQGNWNIGYSTDDLTQTPLNAPTVFNFFYPDYQFPGSIAAAGLTTPEFQLSNDSNTMTLTNLITAGVLNATNKNGFTSFRSGGGSIVLDFGPYMTQAQTSNAGIPALTDTLGTLLTGGSLEASTKTAIISYVANTTNFPLSVTPTNTQMRDRVRAIVHMIIISPDYAIQQ